MAFDNLLLERDAAVAIVTINRPKVLNALNMQTVAELGLVMRELKDDAAVRAVVLTGAGDRAFAAGADITELASLTPGAAREYARAGQRVFDTIEQLGKPVIAAINGYALGGGCELAMSCTLRLAAERARLGQPEINLGLIPGYGGTQRLPRLIGRGRALEMLLTGLTLDAAEAHRIGLVNRVVAFEELMGAARTLATSLAAQPAIAVRHLLEAVGLGLDMPLGDGCEHEAALFGLTAASEDMREGTRAFLEKRQPSFKGQ
jgi:enoyl-CoA hydratase